jgi:hypothetical protein
MFQRHQCRNWFVYYLEKTITIARYWLVLLSTSRVILFVKKSKNGKITMQESFIFTQAIIWRNFNCRLVKSNFCSNCRAFSAVYLSTTPLIKVFQELIPLFRLYTILRLVYFFKTPLLLSNISQVFPV